MGPDRVESLVVVARPWRSAWRGMPRFSRRLGWTAFSLSAAFVIAWSVAMVACFRATAPAPLSPDGITYWCYPRIDGRGYLAITWGDFLKHGTANEALDEATRLTGIEATRTLAFAVHVRDEVRETRIGGRIIQSLAPPSSIGWVRPWYNSDEIKHQWLRLTRYDDGVIIWTDRAKRFSIAPNEGWEERRVEQLDPAVLEAIRDATLRHPNSVSVADLEEGRSRDWSQIEWQGIKYLFWIAWPYMLLFALLPVGLWLLAFGLLLCRAYLRVLRAHCPRCKQTLTAPDSTATCNSCGWQSAGKATSARRTPPLATSA